jgi:hypothetical protein
MAVLMQRTPKQLDHVLLDCYQKVMQLEGVQGVQVRRMIGRALRPILHRESHHLQIRSNSRGYFKSEKKGLAYLNLYLICDFKGKSLKNRENVPLKRFIPICNF